ncbi:MAG: hypothetical protein ABI651_21090 [Verrucomicrobiota bacterium]
MKWEPHVTQANGLVELKVKSWKSFADDTEASNDLKAWTRLTTLTNETGTLPFPDPARELPRLASIALPPGKNGIATALQPGVAGGYRVSANDAPATRSFGDYQLVEENRTRRNGHCR